MSRHVRAAMVGSLLVLGLAPGGVCLRRALARDSGQELKIEGDLKTMQGQWISKDAQGESVWNFKEEHVALKTPTRAYEMTIKLNSKGEPEKHIDFDVSENSPNAKGYKAQGIYKFADDGTLKICFGDGDSGRPKEFKTDFGKSFSFDLKKKK
jgi:uncharacterized protein (TIGR03067 family)